VRIKKIDREGGETHGLKEDGMPCKINVGEARGVKWKKKLEQ
jgi:hypothetical protein